MKQIFAVILLVTSIQATVAIAAVRCAPSPMGGTCCWDTVRDGIFQPVGC